MLDDFEYKREDNIIKSIINEKSQKKGKVIEKLDYDEEDEEQKYEDS